MAERHYMGRIQFPAFATPDAVKIQDGRWYLNGMDTGLVAPEYNTTTTTLEMGGGAVKFNCLADTLFECPVRVCYATDTSNGLQIQYKIPKKDIVGGAFTATIQFASGEVDGDKIRLTFYVDGRSKEIVLDHSYPANNKLDWAQLKVVEYGDQKSVGRVVEADHATVSDGVNFEHRMNINNGENPSFHLTGIYLVRVKIVASTNASNETEYWRTAMLCVPNGWTGRNEVLRQDDPICSTPMVLFGSTMCYLKIKNYLDYEVVTDNTSLNIKSYEVINNWCIRGI